MLPSTQPVSSNVVLPPITAFDYPSQDAPVYNLNRPSQYHYLPYPPQVPSSSSAEPRVPYQPPAPTGYPSARQLWPTQQYSLPQQARAPPQDHNLLVAQQPQERSNFKEVKRRTKTGCQTCRKRRIKCDEGRPACRNCLKSKRVCQGYDQIQQPGRHNPSLLQPIASPHIDAQHSLSSPTSQSDSYILHRTASISSRTSSIATEPDYNRHMESILPPLRSHSPGRMGDRSTSQQEHARRVLPPPDQPIRRAKRCTIDELCTIEGTQRPNLPPLPNSPPNIDAIKTIFDTAFASGLDKLLETTWYTKHAFQYLINDLAFLAQILAYITMIHNRHHYGEEVKLKSQEARITWALLGLCVRSQPKTSHSRCLTGRLHAMSVMLTGEGVPPSGEVVFEDSDGVDGVEGDAPQCITALERQERERQHEFWRAVGRVVSNSWNHPARSQETAERVEAMDAAAKQALQDCRARLDNRESRDLVYSVLLMRHLSEKWARDGSQEDAFMDGAAGSTPTDSPPLDVTRQWNVSKRFIELEASGRSTTLVLTVLAGMALRAWT